MKYSFAFLAALLAAAGFSAGTAQAAPSCIGAARASYFGQIVAVRPAFFTLHTDQSIGDVHVYTRDARVRYDNMAIRPGTYAGVYGCRSGNGLLAENVTLSSSPQSFPGMWYGTSNDRQVTGRVDAVRPGRVLIDSNNGHGDVWVLTSQPGIEVGQLVTANGYFSSNDQAFVAQSIAQDGNGSYAGNSVVEGRIDSVRPGRVLIDSGGGHGNLWVITGRQGLRVGELIRARGTFQPNDRAFVATSIDIVAM
jgi:hypothetical protein